MVTVRDIVTESLLMLGVQAEGEPLDATHAAGALRVLNSLLDAWNLERLLVYVIDRQTFPLTAGTQTYTLGPGGAWDTTPLYGAGTPRPVRLDSAAWRETASDYEHPVRLLDDQEYQHIRLRGAQGTQVFSLHYAPSMPLGSVFTWPKPMLTAQMVLGLWHPWSREQTLETQVVLAPGYQRMLETNLAVDLSARYPGTLREELVALARESKAWVKQQNHSAPRLVSDAAAVTHHGSGGGMYTGWADWLSDRG